MESKKKTRTNAGETLVEVMASIFIFMIMMGILEGAVSYSNAALVKNKEIRANNTAILEQLAGTDATGTDSKTLIFKAADYKVTQTGNQVFSVDTLLQKKEVTYTDTDGQSQSVTFFLYGSPADSGAGTDTPGGGS